MQPHAAAPTKPPRSRAGTLYLVHVLTHATRTRLDTALAPLGVSSFQSTILSVIARDEGLSSSRLSRRFHVTPQAMGETIAALERKDLIERRDDPANRKILRLSLTQAGAELTAKAEVIVGSFEAALFGGVPPGDIAHLREMLSTILASIGDRPV